MDLIKNLEFFQLFIFGKISKQNVFDDILERKKAFLDYKKQKVKKVKNTHFTKESVHGFDHKFGIFPAFHFWQNQQAKCV